jgi:hypothetical protein
VHLERKIRRLLAEAIDPERASEPLLMASAFKVERRDIGKSRDGSYSR